MAFDSVLLVLWTVVAAVANTYTCSGICSACPAGETYYIHTLACDCYQGYYKRGDVDPDVPEIEEGFNDLPNRAYEARTTGPAGVEMYEHSLSPLKFLTIANESLTEFLSSLP